MKKYLVIALIFFVFAGCAGKNLIIHGQVHENRYVSNEAGFSIITPVKWYPTLTPPSPNIEPKIRAKLKRQRELGYIVKGDGTAYIIIETYPLTWGGRPIRVTEITRYENNREIYTTVCEKMLSRERENSKNKFSSFTFECAQLSMLDLCSIFSPCLESTKKMVSKRAGEPIIIEKIYIFEPDFGFKDDAHGWRVHFTLATPSDDFHQNITVFEEVIRSLRTK